MTGWNGGRGWHQRLVIQRKRCLPWTPRCPYRDVILDQSRTCWLPSATSSDQNDRQKAAGPVIGKVAGEPAAPLPRRESQQKAQSLPYRKH